MKLERTVSVSQFGTNKHVPEWASSLSLLSQLLRLLPRWKKSTSAIEFLYSSFALLIRRVFRMTLPFLLGPARRQERKARRKCGKRCAYPLFPNF